MPLLVEFKPPTMYADTPSTKDEIIKLAQDHHRVHLLGKDGRIYDKAVVTCNFHTSGHSGDPEEHCTVEYHAGTFVKTQHLYRN
ncbi:hypothetical protein KC356_g9307 [Hortaea werneckii]|nr:hypothetical protein KC361_g9224 [Hortaea werneckii]KAI6815845.1 hypothetical protein KC342_g15756 [Hortaea werneckii]KAI6855080.1 hypothetical protein KC338_g9005 [Hortaea werneckii]KAI7081104.1 hypothetical protein KC356_g9307 [Hortaea werneckii]KAI7343897.1 hypothetical protein KC320_g9086 [Hortaea werneckii]